MKIKAYKTFKKAYLKLPATVQDKVDKQLEILARDFRHPSLHTKKIKGTDGIWEVRVDDFYRLTFDVEGDAIYLRVVGNNDDVLRKP
jgi:mRNA-degrading endonuclease RelE of RelBE toxin-antitoxin system